MPKNKKFKAKKQNQQEIKPSFKIPCSNIHPDWEDLIEESESIQTKGPISAELISIPGTVPFPSALETVGHSISNVKFWINDLSNQLLTLHESFHPVLPLI